MNGRPKRTSYSRQKTMETTKRTDPVRGGHGLKRDLGEIDWAECPALWRDPKRMSGAWCFRETRLPLHALFSNLITGMTVPEFVKMYPGVDEEDVQAVLCFLADRLEETDTQ